MAETRATFVASAEALGAELLENAFVLLKLRSRKRLRQMFDKYPGSLGKQSLVQ
jgi:hypothetical protein